MINYRYRLDGRPGSPNKKFSCPGCGHKKCFRRYYDYELRSYLSDDCGACDRLNKCSYHYTPKEYFSSNPDKNVKLKTDERCKTVQPTQIDIPFEILDWTLGNYKRNSFISALQTQFAAKDIERVVSDYFIGTIHAGYPEERDENWCAVFWFIDHFNSIRAGQVKLFDQDCKTVKIKISEDEVRPRQTWIHSVIEKRCKKAGKEIPDWVIDYKETEKVTCMYGAHLLARYPHKTVVLVESPKSAIIGSLVYPQYLFIATGGLSYLTKARCHALKGRHVIAMPDLGIPNPRTGKTCLQMWQERADEIRDVVDIKVDSLLEDNATNEERENGADIADYLLRFAREIGNQSKNEVISLDGNELIARGITTNIGNEFGNLRFYHFDSKTREHLCILADQSGAPVGDSLHLEAISKFYRKSFQPALLDGNRCLVSLEN